MPPMAQHPSQSPLSAPSPFLQAAEQGLKHTTRSPLALSVLLCRMGPQSRLHAGAEEGERGRAWGDSFMLGPERGLRSGPGSASYLLENLTKSPPHLLPACQGPRPREVGGGKAVFRESLTGFTKGPWAWRGGFTAVCLDFPKCEVEGTPAGAAHALAAWAK